ncbi:hypothetical protein K469DRAFT_751505 [Zopfia rhizophila CBS 207.26]|uniref:Uncharacterized protein n=1 Tax=Zopfia rhizophila CBS 207.26 TaxID=1314779 RepID=A0A6A6DV73_9PEZI|nr:hypothetical protein K469DRAFT_751505 [Zopfia rhizophila CBS 207.26]
MPLLTPKEDRTFVDGPASFFLEPTKAVGGAGTCSSVPDCTRVLADPKEVPALLKKETVDPMFTPQCAGSSGPHKVVLATGETTWRSVVGTKADDVVPNHGFGGLLVTEDIEREGYLKSKGTLTWNGMTNSL